MTYIRRTYKLFTKLSLTLLRTNSANHKLYANYCAYVKKVVRHSYIQTLHIQTLLLPDTLPPNKRFDGVAEEGLLPSSMLRTGSSLVCFYTCRQAASLLVTNLPLLRAVLRVQLIKRKHKHKYKLSCLDLS